MPALTVNELPSGFTNGLSFNYLDLQATGYLTTGGAANQRVIGSLPAGGYVDLVMVVNTTAESGTTDLTLDVGVTSSDPDEFIDNLDLDGLTYATANTGDALKQSTTGATLPIVGYVNNTTGAVDIIMELNGTHANLTAGAWKILWRQTDPNVAV